MKGGRYMLKSDFFLHCTLKGLSKSTIKYYTDVLNYYQKYIDKDLEQSTVDDMIAYQQYLHDKGLSPASIKNYLTGLKVYYRYLGRNDITSVIVMPKLAKKQVDILDFADLQLILDNCKCLRDEIIVLLMLDCGLRRSEVCRLKVSDWRSDKRLLRVLGKGAKERLQRVGEILAVKIEVYLHAYHNCVTDYLLYTRRKPFLTPSAISCIFNDLKNATGIKLYPHMLRHNYATLYMLHSIKQGNSDLYRLQVLMGHASQNTTLKYLHLAQEQLILSNSYSVVDEALSI